MLLLLLLLLLLLQTGTKVHGNIQPDNYYYDDPMDSQYRYLSDLFDYKIVPGDTNHIRPGEISLTPKYGMNLTYNNLSTGNPVQDALSLFILAHELGHGRDFRINAPYSEDTANKYAYNHFKPIAAKFGVSKQRRQILYDNINVALAKGNYAKL